MKNKETNLNESVYDVRVHALGEKRVKCSHDICLYVESIDQEYSTCICLDCGLYNKFKTENTRIINTNTDSMSALLSFYQVREKYLELKKENLDKSIICEELNNAYKGKKLKRNLYI
jgi:hypothetical protein